MLFIAVAALAAATQALQADDASVLRFGDPRVKAAEEAFILAGLDPSEELGEGGLGDVNGDDVHGLVIS